MTRTVLLILVIAVLASAERLPPVDESASDPSFLAFKVRLLAALQRKDVSALLAATDPKVRVSFGEGDGIPTFRRHWKLDRPAQSKIWSELSSVLKLGATRDEDDFIAPYVFTKFPTNLDAYSHAAVIRSASLLRKAPAPAAPKVADLNFAIVQMSGTKRNGWAEVLLDDGTSGWVREEEIRSPLAYRAFFEKKNGAWKLTAFIAGD